MNISFDSEMDLSFYDSLMEREYRLEQIEVESGYLSEKIHQDSNLPIGTLALIHTRGSVARNIPARDFMLLGAVYWQEEHKVFSKAYIDYVFKRKSPETSFKHVGRSGVRSIQKAIMSQKFVPLKPRTVAEKGSSTILYDTGELINSVEWKVGMK